MKRIAIISATFAMLVSFQVVGAEVEMIQKNKSFSAKEIKIKKGDSIKFTNQDPFFHNIFSLSATKAFDLGSYGNGESKSVVFDKAGQVDVECAIHPSMQLSVTVE